MIALGVIASHIYRRPNQFSSIVPKQKTEGNYYKLLEEVDYVFFLNFYLAAPWPTLGLYRGDGLTYPLLITAFLQF